MLTVAQSSYKWTQKLKQKAGNICLATPPKLPHTPPKVSQHLFYPSLEIQLSIPPRIEVKPLF